MTMETPISLYNIHHYSPSLIIIKPPYMSLTVIQLWGYPQDYGKPPSLLLQDQEDVKVAQARLHSIIDHLATWLRKILHQTDG